MFMESLNTSAQKLTLAFKIQSYYYKIKITFTRPIQFSIYVLN